MAPRAASPARKTTPSAKRTLAMLAGAVMFAGFMALGVWQVERLHWKLDLIARVDARVHAPAAPPPGPAAWRRVTATSDEYRHVRVSGVFENDRETLVQAVTELGPGFWVMTPLRTDGGQEILVNRGFVPPEQSAQASRRAGLPTARTTVTGLLRITEPRGGFLRANQPSAGRWYSRDVEAITHARGLKYAAPFFIDADAASNPGVWPRGGLTVVHFRNSHLVYAVTWFGMAAMTAAWGAWPLIERVRRRRRTAAPARIGTASTAA
jgi:surfeit locus 1 family protein